MLKMTIEKDGQYAGEITMNDTGRTVGLGHMKAMVYSVRFVTTELIAPSSGIRLSEVAIQLHTPDWQALAVALEDAGMNGVSETGV